ncbi:hypothetical protein DCS_02093 [Drechmeria coniospora]|uniref:SCP domain-containing protein n=1 Tax=Drechmeria coniospora TaxID=98403 RepID=A0A151GV61_DRECN|nr:hypothetical protein DCS_02093 [Drechmeria coniospora]KYK60953.1 hypothetical protein DCS_02093 [Drechmeria coniospora]ODA83638.1 hypothetical protein RJ55_02153 [Drechmeria coniospora]
MKASLLLPVSGALLASAARLHPRHIAYVTEVETKTVTEWYGVTSTPKPEAEPKQLANNNVIENTPAQVPAQAPAQAPAQQAAPSDNDLQDVTQDPPQAKVYQPEPQVSSPQQPQPSTSNAGQNSGSISDSRLQDFTNYQNSILDHHNIHRLNHSAPLLSWDDTLAQYASQTAHTCVWKHDQTLGGGGYGQNLASWGSTENIDNDATKIRTAASAVTNQWYNKELPLYHYYQAEDPTNEPDFFQWGHFTQMVWKKTTKVGCASVLCRAGTVLSYPAWYTVCNYDPQGNMAGEFVQNVSPALGKSAVSI